MNGAFLPRVSAAFAVLSVLANVVAFGIGTSRGLSPPNAIDFGNGQHLLDLASNYGAHVLPLALSLAAPCLAIPVALGWWHVLRDARPYAVFGVVMFYVGMILVVILDVLEFILVIELAPAYGAADATARTALLGVGATLGLARDVLGHVGHFFSFGLAQIALGLAILRVRAIPRWLGWLSFVPGVLVGWLATIASVSDAGAVAGAMTGLGILSFVVWFLGMAVVLWRWPDERAT